MTPPSSAPLPVVGWREWVALPDLGVARIKAKLDSGARSSALHVTEMEVSEDGDGRTIRFVIHPVQHDGRTAVAAAAPLLGYRRVRSSNGRREERPVIATTLELLGARWPIELTLTRRDEMGFRMLLGRQALRRRALIDTGRSFLADPPKRRARRKRRAERAAPEGDPDSGPRSD